METFENIFRVNLNFVEVDHLHLSSLPNFSLPEMNSQKINTKKTKTFVINNDKPNNGKWKFCKLENMENVAFHQK